MSEVAGLRSGDSDTSTVPSSHTEPGRYRPAWDVLRIIAAFDIVGHHVGVGYVFGGVGLPIFLLLATSLGVSKRPLKPFGGFIRARFHRILVPWAFWSGVITAGMVLENVLQGRPYFGGFEGAMWLYGPQIHLWFLPFVVMAGAATYALARLVSRWRFPRVPKRYNFVLAIALVAGCMTPFVVPLSLEVAWPFQQWIFGAVAIPLGFVLASIFGQDAKVPSGLLPIPFAIGVAVVAWSQGTVEWVVALRYGIALLLLGVLAVYRSRVASKRVAAVSVLMMGVYILHPAVFQWLVRPGWEAVLGSAPPAGSVWDFPRLEGGPLTEATLSVALTFGLTLIIVRLLRATPLQRFL